MESSSKLFHREFWQKVGLWVVYVWMGALLFFCCVVITVGVVKMCWIILTT